MKLLTPVKAVALTALAATMALPVAHAQPNAPVRPLSLIGHAPVPVLTPSLTPLQAAPQSSPLPKSSGDRDNVIISLGSDRDTHSVLQDTSVPFNIASRTDGGGSITMTNEDVQDILPDLFRVWRKNYVIEPTVYGRVTWNSGDVPLPFDKILDGLVNAASHSFEWSIQDGVYHVRPHMAGLTPSVPHQVQLKFQWGSTSAPLNTATEKPATLTLIAQDCRTYQVSSPYLRNSTGTETIRVKARLEPDDMVVLEIMEPLGVEEIGQELSIKDGQTATVHSQIPRVSSVKSTKDGQTVTVYRQSQLANLGWRPEFSVTASILR